MHGGSILGSVNFCKIFQQIFEDREKCLAVDKTWNIPKQGKIIITMGNICQIKFSKLNLKMVEE